MPKITFLGAGSTIFAKSILGDSLCSPALQESEIALYDIDATRLRESRKMIDVLNRNINQNRATITPHLGRANLSKALAGANYVVNAIQVGGYKPSTVIDFEIPKKFGLRQTIADTLGIGGIFRALRTIPVVLDFAHELERVSPDAWFLNYVNPMAMITGALLEGSSIRSVGLCHSVQGCVSPLLKELGIPEPEKVQWKIAGINHMAWLLEITDNGRDLYPEIKKKAAKLVAVARTEKARKYFVQEIKKAKSLGLGWDWWKTKPELHHYENLVRLDMIRHFGYYITESREHNAEYTPYWIKSAFPELIGEFNIPLDEYPRRCIEQIAGWKKQSSEMVNNPNLTHKRGHEFGSYIMEALETNTPARVHGNILNHGFIPNLPSRTCVEVPCLVDRNGVQGTYVGDLPEQCAALNRTNINVQLLAVDAALKRKKDLIYQAAMLDPHTAAELPLDKIRALCDDLIKAHGKFLPKYS